MTKSDLNDGKSESGEGAIGLILVTHGAVGEALLAALEHIVGPQENVYSVAILSDDDMEARRVEILDAIDRLRVPRGCIVMTDMFGGTPSNLALTAMGEDGVEVIAGVNLPMLIKFASVRSSAALDDAVTQIQESGRKYINVASSFLNPPDAE
jgi:PTS system mannose-specific IIA component